MTIAILFKVKYLMEVGLQFKVLGNYYHGGSKAACMQK